MLLAEKRRLPLSLFYYTMLGGLRQPGQGQPSWALLAVPSNLWSLNGRYLGRYPALG